MRIRRSLRRTALASLDADSGRRWLHAAGFSLLLSALGLPSVENILHPPCARASVWAFGSLHRGFAWGLCRQRSAGIFLLLCFCKFACPSPHSIPSESNFVVWPVPARTHSSEIVVEARLTGGLII